MSLYHKGRQKFSILLWMMLFAGITCQAQSTNRVRPTWWFGESGAVNLNYYQGTTQMLNDNLTVPTAFHKGHGVKPYASFLTEYRPNGIFGGMLNLAFDNRGGKFDNEMAPCNCPATLSTNLSYLAIEPSLRIAPFGSGFYVFGGPTVNFNISRSFIYTQEKQNDTRAEWSNIRKTVFSAQAGAGFDIPLSAPASRTQMTLSPFAAFLTNIGHNPRSVESWSLYTIRAGIALKFGTARRKKPEEITSQQEPSPQPSVNNEIQFTVRAPKAVPVNRQIKETFPLLNSVFFDLGSTEIPSRYVLLNSQQAESFTEKQLQQGQPDNLNTGRAARQLAIYYNILNIIGDRMRSNANSAIALIGSSDKDPAEGKAMAENVKQYLTSVFGIDASRISTEGRNKPIIPSEQLGTTKDISLVRQEDHRVDIVSSSPAMLMQVGGSTLGYLKPVEITDVQEDPLDSYVLFNVDKAEELLNSWSVELTDEQGNTQKFGPYYNDQAAVAGSSILGDHSSGNYKVVMIGEYKDGSMVRKDGYVQLTKTEENQQTGLRYSILFDFDKSQSIDSYRDFLTEIVAPLITDHETVIIHGHTDIVGNANYNLTLSQNRADGAQKILENALENAGRTGVTFETFGFGENESMAPFDNNLPEERFYNRTVIIDIVPAK